MIVENKTPPGQPSQPSGMNVIGKSAREQYYPVPISTMALYREVFPDKPAGGEIENDIGAFVLDGNKIWFANTFYDAEGVSGVGAIGSFDISTRKSTWDTFRKSRHGPDRPSCSTTGTFRSA